MSFKVLDLSMAMQMDLVAPSFLVDASGKMAYVTGASVKAFLGCRTLNKDSDSMASFSFAYLFILFSSQGIFFLCYTVSTFNS
ncbi:hypothetical protein MKX03_006869 [Papaver bracteatum]|nr:hypothetical protein MKX03_006869 [Papaver bracteatum]